MYINKRQRIPRGQSQMDNPENTERAITNVQSREYREGNHKWTIQRIPRGQSQMYNPEKLATQGTQDVEKQNTNRAPLSTTNTNNVNNT